MNPYDPARHHRRSIRLPAFDYRSAGAYFVTVVTHGRQCLFGEVVGGSMCRNATGDVVARCWAAIPQHFAFVTLDEWVIMPNHMHGILILRPATAPDDGEHRGHGRGEASAPSTVEIPLPPSGCFAPAAPRQDADDKPRRRSDGTGPDTGSGRPIGTQSGSLGAVIQNFKSVTTRRVAAVMGGGRGGSLGGHGEALAGDRDGDPGFMAASASPLHSMHSPPVGRSLWQRGYYEHVIRDEAALDRIRRYIRENPLRWAIDAENPAKRTAGRFKDLDDLENLPRS